LLMSVKVMKNGWIMLSWGNAGLFANKHSDAGCRSGKIKIPVISLNLL